ncbi:MAG TPA: hypothetical protein ENH22_00185 [Candidatus Campbellbacteria bacterium]|nr:hypothetical protein [Candidatus Campbellbacteria bacterium]
MKGTILEGILLSNRIEVLSSYEDIKPLKEKIGNQGFVSFRNGVAKIRPTKDADIFDLALSLGESCCDHEPVVMVAFPESIF